MQPPPRMIVWFVVGLGSVGLLAVLLRPQPVRVDVARVERGPLTVTVDAEGKTRLRQRYIISAPVAGRLGRMSLEAGDQVERGTVVARLDPLPLDAAVRAAQARLAELRAQRQGVATLRPKQQALRQAEERISATQAARREAEARVEQARAALEQARRELQRAHRLEALGAISREAREILELTATTRQKELESVQLEVQRALARSGRPRRHTPFCWRNNATRITCSRCTTPVSPALRPSWPRYATRLCVPTFVLRSVAGSCGC